MQYAGAELQWMAMTMMMMTMLVLLMLLLGRENEMGSGGERQGRAIAIGDQSELYYFGPVSCLDLPAAAARVEGQRCGCTAGRVRLILNLSFPLLATILIGRRGWVPLLGWAGFFSLIPFQGC